MQSAAAPIAFGRFLPLTFPQPARALPIAGSQQLQGLRIRGTGPVERVDVKPEEFGDETFARVAHDLHRFADGEIIGHPFAHFAQNREFLSALLREGRRSVAGDIENPKRIALIKVENFTR